MPRKPLTRGVVEGMIAAALALVGVGGLSQAQVDARVQTVGDIRYTTSQQVKDSFAALGSKRHYGAVGDAQKSNAIETTAGSDIITFPAGTITSSAIGPNKKIAIPFAGPSGANAWGETLVTTVEQILSSTSARIGTAASKTVSGPQTITDGQINAGSTTLNSAAGLFTPGHIGKLLPMPNHWYPEVNNGNPGDALIIGYISPTQVTLSHVARSTVSAQTIAMPGATAIWGTDDTAVLQAWITDAKNGRRAAHLEAGNYLITGPVMDTTGWADGASISVFGDGMAASTLYAVGPTLYGAFYSPTGGNILGTVSIRDIGYDGSGLRAQDYGAGGKFLYLRRGRRLHVTNCLARFSASTSFGDDYWQTGEVIGCFAEWAGYLAWIKGGGAGGSGFGYGSGMFTWEAMAFIGCTSRWACKNGFFGESQNGQIKSRGFRVVGCFAFGTGGDDYSDRGLDGSVYSANTGRYFTTDDSFAGNWFSVNTKFIGNTARDGRFNLKWREGDLTLDNNTVDNNGVSPSSSGIYVQTVTGGTLGTLRFNAGETSRSTLRGIHIDNSANCVIDRIAFNAVIVKDSGATTHRPGIQIDVGNTGVIKNLLFGALCQIYDTRATKLQSVGIQINTGTGGAVQRCICNGNDISQNETNPLDATTGYPTYQVTGTGTVTAALPLGINW